MGAPLGSVIVPAMEPENRWPSADGVFSVARGPRGIVANGDFGNDGGAIQEGHPCCDAARGANSKRPTVIPRIETHVAFGVELKAVLKQLAPLGGTARAPSPLRVSIAASRIIALPSVASVIFHRGVSSPQRKRRSTNRCATTAGRR